MITVISVIVVIPIVLVIAMVFWRGLPALSWEFLTQPPRNGMTEGGIMPALLGHDHPDLCHGHRHLSAGHRRGHLSGRICG